MAVGDPAFILGRVKEWMDFKESHVFSSYLLIIHDHKLQFLKVRELTGAGFNTVPRAESIALTSGSAFAMLQAICLDPSPQAHLSPKPLF